MQTASAKTFTDTGAESAANDRGSFLDVACQIVGGPGFTVEVIDTRRPEGRRFIANSLAMMGSDGRELRYAEAGLRMAMAAHRRTWDRYHRGWHLGYGPKQSRDRVNTNILRIRLARARIMRAGA